MIFSRKIHGIQKALVNLSNTLSLSLLPRVFYSMQIRLNGKIWKSDEKLIQLMKLLHVLLHKSVCSSNSPSICFSSVRQSARLSVCPSARPSVCPSVVLPVRHTFKFIESYDKLWITPTSLWSSNILKNAPVLDKKKSFVTLIGCKAKSSQRHRMWGMNVNLSDTCDINDWMAEITT